MASVSATESTVVKNKELRNTKMSEDKMKAIAVPPLTGEIKQKLPQTHPNKFNASLQ